MSYIPTGYTEQELAERKDARAEEFLQIARDRLALEQSKSSSTFWKMAEKVALVGVPLVTFLGLQRYFKWKGK